MFKVKQKPLIKIQKPVADEDQRESAQTEQKLKSNYPLSFVTGNTVTTINVCL